MDEYDGRTSHRDKRRWEELRFWYGQSYWRPRRNFQLHVYQSRHVRIPLPVSYLYERNYHRQIGAGPGGPLSPNTSPQGHSCDFSAHLDLDISICYTTKHN